jgi:hypothetical protein
VNLKFVSKTVSKEAYFLELNEGTQLPVSREEITKHQIKKIINESVYNSIYNDFFHPFLCSNSI